MTLERHEERKKLRVWAAYLRGDSPIVATKEDVMELRKFNWDAVLSGTLKGAITVYGAAVVKRDGTPWTWDEADADDPDGK